MAELKQVEDAPVLSKQHIIEHLERMLERAKNGEYLSIATVAYWKGGGTSHGWSLCDRQNEISCLIGEVAALQWGLVKLKSDQG